MKDKLAAAYTEELIYLDAIIKMLSQHTAINRNFDITIITGLISCYARREQILKSLITGEGCCRDQ